MAGSEQQAVPTDAKVMGIILATHNRGKLSELCALLADLPVEVCSMVDVLGEPLAVVEDGETFEANALKKARAVAEVAHMVTLADDSGLEVDALGGRPGVRSARFASESATDGENNAALLEMLQDVEDAERAARFRCAMALVDPWDPDGAIVVEGRCEGSVTRSPSGTGGFGYDPLFLVEGRSCTMAELSADDKNRISHRARALAAMRPHLVALLERRRAQAAAVSAAD